MSERQAKRLRRIARGASVGKPEVKYFPYEPPHFHVERDNMTGVVVSVVKTVPGRPRLLHPGCTRALVKALKKAA